MHTVINNKGMLYGKVYGYFGDNESLNRCEKGLLKEGDATRKKRSLIRQKRHMNKIRMWHLSEGELQYLQRKDAHYKCEKGHNIRFEVKGHLSEIKWVRIKV